MSNKHKISVMISEDKLQEKIAEIGAKISADYEGKEIKPVSYTHLTLPTKLEV